MYEWYLRIVHVKIKTMLFPIQTFFSDLELHDCANIVPLAQRVVLVGVAHMQIAIQTPNE